MNNFPKLVLVMPVYNEQECIKQVIATWYAELKRLTDLQESEFCFLAINDGSKDNTGALLDELCHEYPQLKVIHQQNAGHGPAIRNGYEQAIEMHAEWVFQTDSDDQFFPDDLHAFWNARQQFDFLLGFRVDRQDTQDRLVITNILRFLVQIFFWVRIKDCNAPYRLIKSEVLKDALQHIKINTFAPNIFLSAWCFATGKKCAQLPVKHKARETGVVSILHFKLLKVCFISAGQLINFAEDVLIYRMKKFF